MEQETQQDKTAGKVVRFEVPGRPSPKERHRTVAFAGADGRVHMRSYTPRTTEIFENRVGMCFIAAARDIDTGDGGFPFSGNVAIEIRAFFTVPKSYSKKRRQECAGETRYYSHKPDSDNIVKAVLDGLNHVAYKDDSSVVSVRATKLYGNRDRTEVTITECGDDSAR